MRHIGGVMARLLTSTSVALWHEMIHDAEKSCAIQLQEEIESYLVFLMMRYMSKPEIVKQILAVDFLHGIQSNPNQRAWMLQEVGDKCLIFTGLFPKQAEKRLVKVSYFVNLGQSSYATISKEQNDLYGSLAEQFVPLMDVLQSVRKGAAAELLPLEAYELWHETGSQRAYSILQQYTTASKKNRSH